ncbi:hypothetical protein HQ571_03775 [Candidatus Kuenenbacteria bacterium]|nr:hypothetical protein [Candidatus Kuenenbacteria bacterium]
MQTGDVIRFSELPNDMTYIFEIPVRPKKQFTRLHSMPEGVAIRAYKPDEASGWEAHPNLRERIAPDERIKIIATVNHCKD